MCVQVLGGHEAPISSLQFNPQKSQLISCGWDKTLRVWSVFTEKGGCETTHLSADGVLAAIDAECVYVWYLVCLQLFFVCVQFTV